MKREKVYFFTTSTNKDRFVTGDKPSQEIFKDLVDSCIFFNDSASATKPGIVYFKSVNYKNNTEYSTDFNNEGYPICVGPIWVSNLCDTKISEALIRNNVDLSNIGTGAPLVIKKDEKYSMKTIKSGKGITINQSDKEIIISNSDTSEENPFQAASPNVAIKLLYSDLYLDQYVLFSEEIEVEGTNNNNDSYESIFISNLEYNGETIFFHKELILPLIVDLYQESTGYQTCYGYIKIKGTSGLWFYFDSSDLVESNYKIILNLSGLTLNNLDLPINFDLK